MPLGKFFGGLFREPADAEAPQSVEVPSAPEEQGAASATRRLDRLRARVRAEGRHLPGIIASRLAQIDDLLRAVISTINAQSASTEQYVLLDAIIDDYVPTPLQAFLALPARERDSGSAATLQLSAQLGILEETISDLQNQIRIGAIAELSTHGRFLASKFNAETLRLDGRA